MSHTYLITQNMSHMVRDFKFQTFQLLYKMLSIRGSKILSVRKRKSCAYQICNVCYFFAYFSSYIPSKRIFIQTKKNDISVLLGCSSKKNKYHWVEWENLCLPYEEGRLNFRWLQDTRKAFTTKW